MQDNPTVTIVVTQRERYSHTEASLASLYRTTTVPFDLVYVDGRSPRSTRRFLDRAAGERGFRLVRTGYHLSPNRARNVGLRFALESPPGDKPAYVLFVDNDVVFTPGWLRSLLDCAETTGASVVTPVTNEGDPERAIIHCAGGESRIEVKTVNGREERRVIERIPFQGRHLPEVRDQLKRGPTSFAEFHCMLVRTAILEKTGPLDEGMRNTREHIDFCFEVEKAGGTIYLEPESLVTYVFPPSMPRSDHYFFMLRWSDAWEMDTLRHFRDKYALTEDAYFRNRYKNRGLRRRMSIIRPFVKDLPVASGNRVVEELLVRADRWVNRLITAGYDRGRGGRTWTRGEAPATLVTGGNGR